MILLRGRKTHMGRIGVLWRLVRRRLRHLVAGDNRIWICQFLRNRPTDRPFLLTIENRPIHSAPPPCQDSIRRRAHP